MPRPLHPPGPRAANPAAWMDWDPATRSPRLDTNHPSFRPLREAGVHLLGQDELRGRFLAGTPCSPTHLVWIVTRGTIAVDYGQGPKEVTRGQMVLCPALRPHWVRLISPSARGLWVHFGRLPRWQILSAAGPAILPSPRAGKLEWVFRQCLEEAEGREFGSEANALHFSAALMVLLERELAAFGPLGGEEVMLTRLDHVWGEVMREPGAKWSVDGLAARAGVSGRELHRRCARLHGIGPMGVVTRIRIERAMELLLSTDRKLDDIATEVGYATGHALSAAFLSHVGRRPGSLRARPNA